MCRPSRGLGVSVLTSSLSETWGLHLLSTVQTMYSRSLVLTPERENTDNSYTRRPLHRELLHTSSIPPRPEHADYVEASFT